MGYNFGMDYGIYPPAEKFLEDMPLWASSYYVHQDLTSNAGALATTVDSSRPPSTKNMTEKEFAVNYTPYASVNVDIPLFTAMYALHDKQFKAALFNGALAKRFLPALQIVCIGSSHGLFGNERARFLMEREFEEHARQKHEVRPVRVINIEGANHLVSAS
jgi:hypothetical protein